MCGSWFILFLYRLLNFNFFSFYFMVKLIPNFQPRIDAHTVQTYSRIPIFSNLYFQEKRDLSHVSWIYELQACISNLSHRTRKVILGQPHFFQKKFLERDTQSHI